MAGFSEKAATAGLPQWSKGKLISPEPALVRPGRIIERPILNSSVQISLQPLISDLAPETRFSILNKTDVEDEHETLF